MVLSSLSVAAGITAGDVALAADNAKLQSQTQSPAPRGRKRVLRIAHLTDTHVQPEKRAGEGLAACLRHVQSDQIKADLILQGGDAVMDVWAADLARAKVQAAVWQKVLKDECSLPIEHCLGNHDIWGFDKLKSGASGLEANWGKQWGLDLFGLSERYRTFDRAGWRFIVLDSVYLTDRTYIGKLDDEQFAWLKKTLEATDKSMPVLVLSHIPILTVTAYLDGENEKSGNWVVPGAWMHIDARKIKDLFAKHPNVKLCLSGHMHMADRVDYLGVGYICSGAVCAGWWNGPNQGCPEGYGVVDLYNDGTFDSRYVDYGWKART